MVHTRITFNLKELEGVGLQIFCPDFNLVGRELLRISLGE